MKINKIKYQSYLDVPFDKKLKKITICFLFHNIIVYSFLKYDTDFIKCKK